MIAHIMEEALFDGPTIEVARRLVGATLVRVLPSGEPDAGTLVSGRIVETEAYLPLVDPSCHGFRGPTKRNASMFGRPGTAYVYFIYGNHYCLNVTTEPPGIGGAVLIRALEPIEGIAAMRRRRPAVQDRRLLSGPGNLCRAMVIDRTVDGANLANDENISITFESHARSADVMTSARIGLTSAATWPLRFYDASSPSVSKRTT
jgi:DNA-3-methyladenine glycosylase